MMNVNYEFLEAYKRVDKLCREIFSDDRGVSAYISHFHIHNNDGFGTNGSADQHKPLNEGSIPMKQLLQRIEELCPDATLALELMKTRSSAQWLLEEGII